MELPITAPKPNSVIWTSMLSLALPKKNGAATIINWPAMVAVIANKVLIL
jgi:hypothetical protein